jgi:hypothetical protein
MNITFGKPNQWGKFQVKIEGIAEINGCQYKTGSGAKGPYEFISMPQRKVVGNNGEEKWVSDFFIDKALAAQILAAYKAQHVGGQSTDEISF